MDYPCESQVFHIQYATKNFNFMERDDGRVPRMDYLMAGAVRVARGDAWRGV